jgi:Maltokinase N-terminal cap domain
VAVIHPTTLVPSKLELLTAWLPRQDWWVGGLSGSPLAKVGGFRLDDPTGQVGIELMVVGTDAGPRGNRVPRADDLPGQPAGQPGRASDRHG